MRKIIITTLLAFSSFIYANDDQHQTSFFSSETESNDIGTVDDPDDPNTVPINDSAYMLLIIATGVGLVYFRNKSIKVVR